METPGHNSERSLETLLITIFSQWRAHGIEFLILRNYENLPVSTGNDVDVLVRPDQVQRAEEIMCSAAEKVGYLLHNRVEFATLSCFFHHPGTLGQIQIDLFSSLKWHTFELLSANDIVGRRIDKGLFSIPSPVDEGTINLITRLIYGGQVKESYKKGILYQLGNGPAAAEELLAEAFGRNLARRLLQAALGTQWDHVVGLQKPLRRGLVLRSIVYHPLRTACSLLADGLRLFRRIARPGGLVIVMLGADGSGKSTVASQAIDHLKNTFNPGKMLNVHWKPVVFFKAQRVPSGKPNVNPHGRPPRSKFVSFVYLCAHWLEFFIGSHVQFRRTAFKNGLVLVDRYYYDFFVDPRRYRLNVPQWLVRLMFTAIPKPDLVFLLDAPPETLQSRKQEVPMAETSRQVALYREVVAGLPHGHVLDASQPVEMVATKLVSTVLQYLRDRARRR